MSRFTALLVLCVMLIAGCTTAPNDDGKDDGKLPPLYITIVLHSEEDMGANQVHKSNIPDYDGDKELMLHFSRVMRLLGQTAQKHGAKINFGTDWTFSKGVARYDPTFYKDLEAMGHEVDAHAHESWVMYHEVRANISAAGGTPTTVASGLNEAEVQDRLTYLDTLYPEFKILWGVSLPSHDAGEELTSYVWRPSRTDWLEHDPDGKYIYIGHGDQMNNLTNVNNALGNRNAKRVNTYSYFVTDRDFLADKGAPGIDPNWTAKAGAYNHWATRLAWWDALLNQTDKLVSEKKVEYRSLTEIANIFESKEKDLDFDFGAVPRSTEPMVIRSRNAGYIP